MGQAKAAASIRFEGALLVTQDPERRVLRGDLEVRDGRITAVGRSTGEAVEQTVDARRRAIVPGFINLHGHVAMTLLRGIADDRDLGGFL
ncbi:MAG: amidohydrolase family protein, partial [Thermoplasmata archaeon]